jgi:hypothetical protein
MPIKSPPNSGIGQALHTEILAIVEAALAYLDEHGLALPAVHLSSAIEALQAQMDGSIPGECPPETEED